MILYGYLVVPSVISVVVTNFAAGCNDFEVIFVITCNKFDFVYCDTVIVVFVGLSESCCRGAYTCVVESDALSFGK